MNYRVDWSPRAEQMLAAVRLDSYDREGVADDAALVDERLGRAPLSFGESRTSSVHRVGYLENLGVEFEVIEDDKHVLVHAVFAIG